MNSRIWRTSALVGSVTLVVLLSTQGAAGQPPAATAALVPQTMLLSAGSLAADTGSTLPVLPESASLLLLGAAFALAARQLRRVI
jgi:hypothetical protein